MKRTGTSLPAGWDETMVRDVIAHYDSQTEDEAVVEDQAAFADDTYTVMLIPCDLVPAVQALLSESPHPIPDP